MKGFLALLLIAASHLLNAQSTTLHGLITDENNQPVPLAHVSINKQVYTVADLDGSFALVTNRINVTDTLTITAVGFIAYQMPLSQYQPGTELSISLQPDTYLLDGVTISKHKARNHWLKALQKLQTHLPSTAYTYPAFFRQMHIENGAYVRLIEAGMTVYDVAATYQAGILQERFSLQQVRRSNVLERNGDQHGDHLVDMFMENSLRYPTGTIMDSKIIAQFDISFDDASCTICGDSLEQLTYRYEKVNDPKILEGKIWLYTGSMKLYAIEEVAMHNPKYYQNGMSLGGGGHHWMFQESQKTLRFQYVEGKIYLSNLYFEYLHHIQDRTVGIVRYEITERFHLFCDVPTVQPNGFVPDKGFARTGNLYSRKYQYEEGYWKQFPLALENPLPLEVVETLSGKVPLHEQFKKNGE